MRRSTIRAASRALAAALMLAASGAHAEGSKLPQMDFTNPLTIAQIGWMAAILLVLYLVLARWGLPRIGGVIAQRTGRIKADLDAAQKAREDAQAAIRALDAAIREARAQSDRTVADAVDAAKARAHAEQAASNAKLEARLAEAEAEIARARGEAMAALLPIAADVASGLFTRITGHAPDRAALDRALLAAPQGQG